MEDPTPNQVSIKHLIDVGMVQVGGLLTSPSETSEYVHWILLSAHIFSYEEAEITRRGTILCLKSNTEFETPTAWVKSVIPQRRGWLTSSVIPDWKGQQKWLVLCSLQGYSFVYTQSRLLVNEETTGLLHERFDDLQF